MPPLLRKAAGLAQKVPRSMTQGGSDDEGLQICCSWKELHLYSGSGFSEGVAWLS